MEYLSQAKYRGSDKTWNSRPRSPYTSDDYGKPVLVVSSVGTSFKGTIAYVYTNDFVGVDIDGKYEVCWHENVHIDN